MSTARRPIGLWMLPAHLGTNPSALAALRNEFASLRTLDHPNIVRMVDLGCNGERYYVTGERLEGISLRTVLAQLSPERVDVHEADDIVRAIGSALAYAHEREIPHGDVRAENVLVTLDRRFLLTNFLARRIAQGARPPHKSDDVRGLARLAAELYTGVASGQDLRGAAHGPVPAARLNAIRSVLEATKQRRTTSVAEFLVAAELAPEEPRRMAPRMLEPALEHGAALGQDVEPRSWRTWSIHDFVVPVCAVIGAGILAASYRAADPEWRDTAPDGEISGSSTAAPQGANEPTTDAAAGAIGPMPEQSRLLAAPPAVAPAAAEPGAIEARPTPSRPADAPQEQPQEPAANLDSGPRVISTSTAPQPTPQANDGAAVVSLGVPRIAAREDHTVVALDVVRSGDTSREVSVAWLVSPDTAHEEEDYADIGMQTLTFAPGATVARALVPLVNDGVREADEVFTVHLSRPRGGVAGSVTTARVTVHDDD